MLVRVEKIKDTQYVLVVDEVDRFIGEIYYPLFKKSCLLKDETVEIDDYEFYFADKEKLIKCCKK
jgi:hypothetical protein